MKAGEAQREGQKMLSYNQYSRLALANAVVINESFIFYLKSDKTNWYNKIYELINHFMLEMHFYSQLTHHDDDDHMDRNLSSNKRER